MVPRLQMRRLSIAVLCHVFAAARTLKAARHDNGPEQYDRIDANGSGG